MQTINPKHLTAAQFRRLADIKDQITALEHEFHVISTTGTPVSMPTNVHRGRQWSAARRKKFEQTIATRNSVIRPVGYDKPRKPMSAKARAKIGRAMKKRWKKAWAAGKTTL